MGTLYARRQKAEREQLEQQEYATDAQNEFMSYFPRVGA